TEAVRDDLVVIHLREVGHPTRKDAQSAVAGDAGVGCTTAKEEFDRKRRGVAGERGRYRTAAGVHGDLAAGTNEGVAGVAAGGDYFKTTAGDRRRVGYTARQNIERAAARNRGVDRGAAGTDRFRPAAVERRSARNSAQRHAQFAEGKRRRGKGRPTRGYGL